MVRVSVVGTGYVGLVAGACFADIGHHVICVDIDENKINKLTRGIIPIYEPGLEEIVKKNFAEKRLEFTTDIAEAIAKSDVVFSAVGTPPLASGEANLEYVRQAAKQLAENADSYRVFVQKSTVPVKTGEMVSKILKANAKPGVEFDVVSNPEFLREGSAVDDFMKPDRVVIGADTDKAYKLVEELYLPLNAQIIRTDVKSAELIKHAANAFLATKISFINAVAQICELSGANVENVAKGIGTDSRIGSKFLNAGIGYGGSCFPKDVRAFVDISAKLGYDFTLLKETVKINKNQRQFFVDKIEKTLGDVNGKTIGVLGLAFKPNTDDMREAPAIDVINTLTSKGAKIKTYDPEAMENAKNSIKDAEYVSDMYEVAENADALVIVTEWKEFKEMDLNKIKELLKEKIIIDGRNMFDPKEMEEKGFTYVNIGRGI